MNISNFEHVLYALLIQAAVWLLTRSWVLGAVLVTGVFIGREHAQREYNAGGLSKLSPWEAFNIWDWSLDAQLDLALPVLAVLMVAWGMRRKSR